MNMKLTSLNRKNKCAGFEFSRQFWVLFVVSCRYLLFMYTCQMWHGNNMWKLFHILNRNYYDSQTTNGSKYRGKSTTKFPCSQFRNIRNICDQAERMGWIMDTYMERWAMNRNYIKIRENQHATSAAVENQKISNCGEGIRCSSSFTCW